MDEMLSVARLTGTNNTVLCNAIIQLRNLVMKGDPTYKERIYEGQAILIVHEFDIVYKDIRAALLKLEKVSDISQEKMENLHAIIKAISDLVKRVHTLVKKLPEAKRFQKHLSKFQMYKSDFAKFTKELSALKVKLDRSLTDLGLPPIPLIERNNNGYNVDLMIEIDSLLTKKELFRKLQRTPALLPQQRPVLIKQSNGESPLFYIYCVSKSGNPQLIELDHEMVHFKKLDFERTRNIFISDNQNIEIFDEIALKMSFEEDEQKLCGIFRVSNRNGYKARPSRNQDQDRMDTAKYEEIVETQVASLKEYMAPSKASRLDRLNASFIVPSCELQFLEKLTSGTSGVIYKGLFRKQPVVIKALEGIVGESVEKTLFNEIQTMSCVRSKYVTQLYGVCWEKNLKCLIIEYMPKGSLYHCLDQMVLTPKEQLQIALDIAGGIYNLSCQGGMTHGNLNSYNIMITDSMGAKLTDFSCAKSRQVAMTSIQEAGRQPIQSFEWSAPELYDSSIRTRESDVYSFGVILWEICTGKHPFAQRNLNYGEFVNNLKLGVREPLAGIEPQMAKLINGCWCTNPHERLTIEEVMEFLENYQQKPRVENAINDIIAVDDQPNPDPVSQHRLALSHLKGINGKPNYEMAYKLFLSAATQGNVFSKLHLANMHIRGLGAPLDIMQAERYFNQLIAEPRVTEKCPAAINQLYTLLCKVKQEIKAQQNPRVDLVNRPAQMAAHNPHGFHANPQHIQVAASDEVPKKALETTRNPGHF